MSGRLVGEVVDWLCTPAAADLTLAERVVLLVIAERANETTREMWRFRTDDVTLAERIQQVAKLDADSLRHALQRLKKRGLEVRVPIKFGKDGRPIYSFKGHATSFRLPELPASVELPQRGTPEAAFGVEKPVDNSSRRDGKGGLSRPPKRSKGDSPGRLRTPKAASGVPPNTYEELPYKKPPYVDGSSPYVAEEEDTRPAAATPSGEPRIHMGWESTYKDASALLQTLPDLGSRYMAQAENELRPGTRLSDRVIYAAQLAKEAHAS